MDYETKYKHFFESARNTLNIFNETKRSCNEKLCLLLTDYYNQTKSKSLVLEISDEEQHIWVGDVLEDKKFGEGLTRIEEIQFELDNNDFVTEYRIFDEYGVEYSPDGLEIQLFYACAYALANNANVPIE